MIFFGAVALVSYSAHSQAQVTTVAPQSEEPYVISGWLKYMTSGAKVELETDYYKTIGMRGGALIITGILLFLIFVWWSCCGCGCCPCCPRNGDVNCCFCSASTAKKIYIFLAVACAVSAVGMAWFGLQVDKDQKRTMEIIPSLTQNMVNWKDDVLNATKEITDPAGEMITLLNQPPYAGKPGTSDLTTDLSTFIADGQKIIDDSADVGVDKLNDFLGDDFDKIDDYRSLGMKVILGVLLAITLLQITIALMDSFCKEGSKPKDNSACKCIGALIFSLALLCLFLCWLLAGILMVVSTVTADVCDNPEVNIVTVADLAANDTLKYFIECSTLTPAQQTAQNPFQKTIDDMATLKTSIDSGIDTVVANCPSSNAQCNTTNPQLLGYKELINVVPLQEQLACATLNGKWNAVANALCGSFGESVAGTTVLMIAFAMILTIGEVVRRKLRDSAHFESNSKVNPI